MSSPPMMPEHRALQNDASMLTKRFGKEIVNYYAGSQLNRYSFLRSDSAFLRRAVNSPSTRFIALDDLSPLVSDAKRLVHLTLEDIKPLIGSEPFGLSDADAIKEFDSAVTTPLLVFLGTVEGEQAAEIETTDNGVVKAQPFFAIDVTPRGSYADAATAFLKQQEDKGLTVQTNTRLMTLGAEAACMYAQARSMIDWNTRHPFCAGCGTPNLSIEAGYKRVCPPADRSGAPRGDCHTRHGVSNLCFPRSDPTMIAAVVSPDGQRILLGRQARYPPDWYSTLAGFLEPGESVEEAVRREVWEEAGVRVGRVVIHSTQPWPYPSTLMLGAIAQALPGEETITLNDKELETAKWFTLDEVRTALKRGTGSHVGPLPEGYKEGDLRVPPPQAIANRLMAAVVEGYLTGNSKI
ncbi:putative NADH pyrophosphatase [Tolypocladium ophioglossoides CBS 100239]|uniref:NAD(+) diphosphatase n=1 Tax=Tolypocladium ophioglossoides (strain CBS 100239) TaxID=1163406 RepID=A0A0L0NE62_TOLOC|nr:putative NADH pyrophosphatase [Tolypocladium ophioglossoides CBS 100239]